MTKRYLPHIPILRWWKKERKDIYEDRKGIENNNNSNGRTGRMFWRSKERIKKAGDRNDKKIFTTYSVIMILKKERKECIWKQEEYWKL